MQLIVFICREKSTALGHETGKGRRAVSKIAFRDQQELRFLLLQCYTPPVGSTLFAAIKTTEG
jgi:hypothetical protein